MTEELFTHPGSEYRAAPFWAWNSKLNKEELLWQMEQLKSMGFGGVHIHVRTGLETEYLGREFFDLVQACIDKARQEHMLIWLYDEDRWPSGAAGGLVTKDIDCREKTVVLTRVCRPNGFPIATYDVSLSEDGTLKEYKRISPGSHADGFPVYAYQETMADSPWYNNQAYVNTLDPESIRQFIHVTHDAYAAHVGQSFGEAVPAIFTDEPHFAQVQSLNSPEDTRDISIPWTDDLPKSFQNAYGMDLLNGLPELLWDLPDGKPSLFRYRFFDHVTERFAQAFADQIGKWCEQHGLMLTGHLLGEGSVHGQIGVLGEAMRSYRSFQIPGIDILNDAREYTTAKQAQSAARQYGREGVMSELYGVTNWNFDFRNHKLQGDWQAALGVTLRVPHLSWYSMNGQAKRDYPATLNYQIPWYKEYGYVEDHFARLNTALTRGKALCRVGVIHPVESCWLHFGPKKSQETMLFQINENFQNLTAWLLRGMIDFDFISESLLPSLCLENHIGKTLPVGNMEYDTILIPPLETLRHTTVVRLRKLIEQGGRVLFLGNLPSYMDAAFDDAPKELYAMSEHCPFERAAILSSLSAERQVEVLDEQDVQTNYLFYQMRQEEEKRWLFICHADPDKNPDTPICRKLRIRVRGCWKLTLYDTINGRIMPVDAAFDHGWTEYISSFYDHDSLLWRLEPSFPAFDEGCLKDMANSTVVCRFLEKMDYTLDEPNVLLLDRAEYALDNGSWQPAEDILRLDQNLRDLLGWPHRGGGSAQPWVECSHSFPHILHLRYRFDSEIDVEGAELALENAPDCIVRLNNVPAGGVTGWYADHCIGKVALPDIRAGENLLEVSMPYGRRANPEAMYLLGSFGDSVQGVFCAITKQPGKITFGDWTRQGFPFYGGSITYHMRADLEPGRYILQASQYRAALLRVSVDGADQGRIAFSPYKLSFDITTPGEHIIAIKAFGCRINTFGQLHHIQKKEVWWGPGSWRTKGENWSYEYQFWEQGILKSPELLKALATND